MIVKPARVWSAYLAATTPNRQWCTEAYTRIEVYEVDGAFYYQLCKWQKLMDADDRVTRVCCATMQVPHRRRGQWYKSMAVAAVVVDVGTPLAPPHTTSIHAQQKPLGTDAPAGEENAEVLKCCDDGIGVEGQRIAFENHRLR
ncbi:unnamed protein product [Soboliphyme baturini]|uniref:Tudor domain-containing protein n=1 Tax=Soboliphyme baturini TaxID=241478 RepID=A0A183IWM3_9BILA|nr:unnamed protein product [Soboliphyme baturini]